jgi:DNA-binding Xre family transcriptional regulator
MFNKNLFKSILVLRGVSMRMLAEVLGIDESTLYRKINSGGSFTREEINKMIEYLEIDNPMEVFFYRELA